MLISELSFSRHCQLIFSCPFNGTFTFICSNFFRDLEFLLIVETSYMNQFSNTQHYFYQIEKYVVDISSYSYVCVLNSANTSVIRKKDKTQKQSTPNFLKNEHFLPSDMHTGSKKFSFFGKFGVLCFLHSLDPPRTLKN